MDKAKLRKIFIEEASEIIEKLDLEIVNLEENPSDKALLNEIFRGIHTLKGSANSFDFKRLGGFVHGFEDILDLYRRDDSAPTPEVVDLFLRSVDVIKEIFSYEINDLEGVPSDYEACLEGFKALLASPVPSQAQPPQCPLLANLATEFSLHATLGDSPLSLKEIETQRLLPLLQPSQKLYKITIHLDEDIYRRGQDHTLFLRLLRNLGTILYSHWDMSAIPPLEALEIDRSYIKGVTIYLASDHASEEVEEIFLFLEEYEYALEEVQALGVETSREVDIPSPATPKEESPLAPTPPQAPSKAPPAKGAPKPPAPSQEEKRSFVKIETSKLDELFDSIGELVIAQNSLGENEAIKALKKGSVGKNIETLSKITRLIQNRVMSLRMVPIRETFEKMRRVARDASKKVGKEVRLQISGEETEIDKNMVDALSEPLIHIIRNAIDHGIEEDSATRLAQGKPESGTVELRAYHRAGSIVVEIVDDGRGISRERVYQKALDRGIITPEEELSEAQIYALILQPGFSTAKEISDVSGRGVGLDVVRSSIEALRGRLEIDSSEGQGSRFTILLPLTLAIIDGMFVKSAGETFIIPTLSIVESFRPPREILHVVQGEGEFVNLREELLPIIRLNRVLELDEAMPEASESILVCVEGERGRVAILVDELVGRSQVVIKTLGKMFAHLQEISGGAVLGNGEIALIVNVDGLR